MIKKIGLKTERNIDKSYHRVKSFTCQNYAFAIIPTPRNQNSNRLTHDQLETYLQYHLEECSRVNRSHCSKGHHSKCEIHHKLHHFASRPRNEVLASGVGHLVVYQQERKKKTLVKLKLMYS